MRILVPITLLLASAFATAESVRLANGEWSPYLSPDLENDGPVSQLVREAFEAAGIEVEYVFMPWKRSYEEARDGSLDGTLIWSHTQERANDFVYSDPVIVLRTALYYRHGESFDWSQPEDLEGLRIGGVIGYSYGLEEEEDSGLIRIERIAEPENNYRKLLAGRLDLVAEDERVAAATLRRTGLAGLIVPHPRAVKEVSYHVLFSRENGNADSLAEKFNAALEQLKQSGRYQEILGTLLSSDRP